MEKKEDKFKRVAQMLENASNILRGTESTENSQMHQTSGLTLTFQVPKYGEH